MESFAFSVEVLRLWRTATSHHITFLNLRKSDMLELSKKEEDPVIDVLDMSMLEVVVTEACVETNRDLRITGISWSTEQDLVLRL